MTIPDVTRGRGAWSPIAKDNGSRYYTYIEGRPLDGSSPEKDANYQAVSLGVKAIQARINEYKVTPLLTVDGVYGRDTAAAVTTVQDVLGLSRDGVAGPATCKALFRDLLIWFGGVYHVPASQLHGFIMLESGYDPGAVGIVSPADRGLNQINETAHPDVSDEEAFNPVFSIDYTAKRLQAARIKYSGKTVDLKNRCAIAQHNSPRDADEYYRLGYAPNDRIKAYVDRVLEYALQFKA